MTPKEARQYLELRQLWNEFLRSQLEARKLDYAQKCLSQTISTEARERLATRGAETGDLIVWLSSQIESAEKLVERHMP